MSPAVDDLNKTEKTIRHTLDGFSYVLVPAPLYQEKDKEKYLDFLGLTDDKGVVCVDYIEIADIYNVYRAESENKVARHATSVLLENIIKENTERTDDARVYLNVKDQRFEMFILEGAKLLLYNTFRFKTKEDFLYFLLFSMEQLHLETETTPVYFLGMIEKDSQIVELVSRYIRDVRFKKEQL